ncbi:MULTISPECIES: NADP(H)-dependent aldo-keto reductase [unclassified Agarivorans]|uniref:NADP(H)-dependent aldo-keto reductase n=1 Tax=unclassified Agarivorans TaxID=2636026 RepID=UPI0026E35B63|nr:MULTISPECIES: NADP(H)-dependent aldo-keto reductase [unclassified Agarivorans]MDO6684539.1 NADP(H)-dependent aldo-keto reductase [Agarivorans sp. 3_MG-2023]MDO6714704.1 NADP(H)-dependent aldo-keto reductase [Agarivorans sp. 2_MG-2023]
MKYRQLGDSNLNVSEICLGTMTWGEQNSQADAFAQLDYALANGVNFIDTAEMYPVPPQQSTQGATEIMIGNYFAQRDCRDEVILASKVAAPSKSDRGGYIRNDMSLTWNGIHQAVEDSLNRLQTDYLDLYQVHWPDRATNFFGQLNYQHQEDAAQTPIIETLEALADLVKTGKVRYLGISNETPWGAMRYVQLAEKHNLPKIVSIQNPYNLLNRSFEINLAEVSHRENLPLLAYSPLAFGALSGKYLNNQWPEGARLTIYKRFARYGSDIAEGAIQRYVDVAREFDLSPVQLALAFVNQRSFVGSNIIGATSLAQLKENLSSTQVVISDELERRLQEIGDEFRIPCP